MGEVFRMTDKEPTKQLPCTFAGCENEVIVTKFYSPAKARCPEHAGKASVSTRAAVASGAVKSEDVEPVRSLADLRCPMCDRSMRVAKVEQVGKDRAFMTFNCSGEGGCGTTVVIKPKWAGLTVEEVPEPWQAIVGHINSTAKRENEEARARELKAKLDEEALEKEQEAGKQAEKQPAKKKRKKKRK